MQVGMATLSMNLSTVPEVPMPVYPGGTSLSLSKYSIYGATTVYLPYAGDAVLQYSIYGASTVCLLYAGDTVLQ